MFLNRGETAQAGVAAETTNAGLHASMDRRVQRLEHARPGFDATLATGVLALILVLTVWVAMRRLRDRLEADLPD